MSEQSFQYLENGRKIIDRYKGLVSTTTEIYKYDVSNRLTESRTFGGGKLLSRTEINYTVQGQQISTLYDIRQRSIALPCYITTKYINKQGQITSVKIKSWNGSQFDVSNEIRSYTNNNNDSTVSVTVRENNMLTSSRDSLFDRTSGQLKQVNFKDSVVKKWITGQDLFNQKDSLGFRVHLNFLQSSDEIQSSIYNSKGYLVKTIEVKTEAVYNNQKKQPCMSMTKWVV